MGVEGLSKQVGFLNDEVHDHTRNLINMSKQYGNLDGIGKKWLNQIDFKGMLKKTQGSLTEANGMFFSARTSMTKANL
jgi:hypothetical protein